jgi:hypothetical protein
LDEDIGNASIDTATSATSTVPEKKTLELVTDFAVTRLNYRRRPNTQGHHWDVIKARFQGVPILIENKRSASRRLKGYLYARDVEKYVNRARLDVMRQAAFLFHMHPHQQSVVLIAASGLFWSSLVVDRTAVMTPADAADAYDPSADDSEDEGSESESEGEDDIEEVEGPLSSGDELDLIPRQREVIEPRAEVLFHPVQPVEAEDELVLPTTTWTGLLELDTEASAQIFFMIHRRLLEVAADRTGANG